MAQATHYVEYGADRAVCGRKLLFTTPVEQPKEVTCKRCLHKLNAPKFVGQHRMRLMYQVTMQGGPYDGQIVVLPRQDSGHVNAALSLPIRVGGFTGRYNLNTGTWVPKESAV